MGQRAVLRHRNFRFFWVAGTGSALGTWITAIALTIDIWDQTESGVWVSAVLIAELMPIFVIALIFGSLVDRLSRRGVMVSCDVVRAGVFVVLPFANDRPHLIVASALLAGFANGFFRPGLYAAIANLVPGKQLPMANAVLFASESLSSAIGPIAGGGLVALSTPDLAYWINSGTFFWSAILLLRIPASALQVERAPSRGHWLDILDGWRLVRNARPLLAVLLAWGGVMLSSAAYNVSEVALAKVSLGAGDFGFGLLSGSSGLGLMIGSLGAAAIIERYGTARTYSSGMFVMALGIGAAAVSPNIWIAGGCVVISGLGNGVGVVCNALLVQRGAPDALRGRAFTLIMSLHYILLGIGMVVAGYLVEPVGPRVIWVGAAVCAGISALIGYVLLAAVQEKKSGDARLSAIDAERAAEAPQFRR